MRDTFSPEQIARAKRDTELVALVREKMELKRSGTKWTACCPFHTEKRPSFYVDPSRNTYKCFGCGASGDAIQWLRVTQNLSFPEAVSFLLKRLNLS